MKEEDCLQQKYGPTPCFQFDVKKTICSLDFCPVARYLEMSPETKPFDALHSHCVMSENYGRQSDFEEGKGEFFATIAALNDIGSTQNK